MLDGGFDLGTAYATIELRTDGLDASIRQAQSMFDSIGSSLSNTGKGLMGVGGAMVGLSAPLLIVGQQGLDTAADFDTLMRQIQVFGGVAPDQLERVRQFALQMGADTKFSSQDAGAALLDLLKSGQTLEEAMATLPSTLNLAAVGEISLAQAAGITSSAIAQYNLEAGDAARISDALARAANASRADVADLGQALINAGPVAAQFGLSIEDTAAMLGVFADNGVMGAEAGTQLRSMLLNMNRPVESVQEAWSRLGTSLYDSDGNIRNLNIVFQELDEALDQLPVQEQNELIQQLAGTYGIVGFNALRAAGGIGEMTDAMDAAPDAATVAQSFMDSYRGSVEQLSGAGETFMIEFMTPFMNNIAGPFVNWLTEVVNGLTEWAMANPGLTQAIATLVVAVGALGSGLVAVGGALFAIGTIISAFASGGAIATAVSAIAGLAGAISLPVVAIGALALAFATDFMGIRTTVETTVDAVRMKISDFLFQMRNATPEDAVNHITRAITGAFESLAAYPFDVAAEFVWLRIRAAFRDAGIALPMLDAQSVRDDIVEALESIEFPSVNIDLTPLRTSIENVVNQLPTFDFSPLQTSIESSFTGLDFSSVQTTFEQHFDTIVGLIVTAAGIIFGGPIGLVIGAGKLVASAIENDFLGIGTFLEQTNITAALEEAFNTLKAEVERIVGSLFGTGEGEKGKGGETPELMIFGRPISELVSGAANWLAGIGKGAIEDISAGLGDLGAGIEGFIESLSGTEVSGLDEIVASIVAALGAVIGLVAKIGGNLIGGLLSGVGKALPGLGEAISGFITAISRVGEGNWGGALQSLGDGIKGLISAFGGFTTGLADGVIGALEDLLGIDLPSASEGLEALGRGLSAAWMAIQIVFDRIKRGLEIFFLGVQSDVLGFIATFRQQVLDATGGQIDIAPDINFNLAPVQQRLMNLEWADAFESAIRGSIGPDGLDLSQAIQVGEQVVPIGEFLRFDFNVDAMAEELSFTGRQAVEDALAQAFRAGDAEAFNLLVPLALDLGIDIDSLTTQITEDIIAAGDAQTYAADPNVDATLHTPLSSLMSQIADFILDAGAAQTYPADANTRITLGTALFNLTQQIGSFVTQAASAQTFNASSTANVTVNSGSINTSPLASAVSSAIQGALAIASMVAQSFRIPGRAGGGDVAANTAYMVGERGPELFISNTAGTIVPNHALASAGTSAAGGSTYITNIDIPLEILRDEPYLEQHADRIGERLEQRRRERGF